MMKERKWRVIALIIILSFIFNIVDIGGVINSKATDNVGNELKEEVVITEDEQKKANILLIQDEGTGYGDDSNAWVMSEMEQKGWLSNWTSVEISKIANMQLGDYEVIIVAGGQSIETYEKYNKYQELFETYVEAGGTLVYGTYYYEQDIEEGFSTDLNGTKLPGGLKRVENAAYKGYINNSEHLIVTTELTETSPLNASYPDGTGLTDMHLLPGWSLSKTVGGSKSISSGTSKPFSTLYFDKNTLPEGSQVILSADKSGNQGVLIEYPLGEGTIIATSIAWERNYVPESRFEDAFKGYYMIEGGFSIEAMDDLYAYAVSISNEIENAEELSYTLKNWIHDKIAHTIIVA